ncbi:hydroxymethylbilane synthase [Sphingomicrobium sediminis]|uniref:Porphobilinogen deaminase n=1 Tax=Sphingomicrobium sediminis TaxID=2950949 RepID=A0A9X2EI86_9SPHN|nr:hydroxymethylbilane synthase [Sphingomicrobium sediminis]MCM8558037.1 hydroxymethylbilane synthase [Sphingomicrobium sediminis]
MTLRLGTRGSPLALKQAEMVRDALIAAHGWDSGAVEIVTISTKGDRDRVRPLTEMGGKAVWTKELDRALLAGETDISVHSMKDVESIRPEGLGIAAMLERADVRDKLIGAASLDDLPDGAVIGTASPRRVAQVKGLRPGLRTDLLRGNIATRIAAVENGKFDATLLASAGLDRMDQGHVGHHVELDVMLPAPAQGAIGIDARSDDAATRAALAAINHVDTFDCVMAERAFVAGLNGDCHSPVAALAQLDGDHLHLSVEIYSEDGSDRLQDKISLDRSDTETPKQLARDMLAAAPDSIKKLFG